MVLVVLWEYCQIPMWFFCKILWQIKTRQVIVKLQTLWMSDFFFGILFDVWFDPSFIVGGNLVICAQSDKDLKLKPKSWKYGQKRFLSSFKCWSKSASLSNLRKAWVKVNVQWDYERFWPNFSVNVVLVIISLSHSFWLVWFLRQIIFLFLKFFFTCFAIILRIFGS